MTRREWKEIDAEIKELNRAADLRNLFWKWRFENMEKDSNEFWEKINNMVNKDYQNGYVDGYTTAYKQHNIY